MRKLYICLFILTVAGLSIINGCIDQAGQKATPATTEKLTKGYRDINAPEMKAMMSKENVFLIDTHIPEQQHIKGTNEFIPYDQIEANTGKLPVDKNARIVVYCRSGSMSVTASEKLVKLGYTQVYNLLGGTNGWRKQGYEFEERNATLP